MMKKNFITPPNFDLETLKYQSYLPTSFTDEMTILQKINKIIYAVGKYTDITHEMLDKWQEVYSWIVNDGLDEMVRYRLDEWLKNGTLHEIINTEIFNELNVKINDIENKVDGAVDELQNLVNEKMKDLERVFNRLEMEINENIDSFKNEINKELISKVDTNAYYCELEFTTHRHLEFETTYYIVKIPRLDKEGKRIVLKQGIASDKFNSQGSETVRGFSKRKGATMVSNLSPSTSKGRIIHKGKILQDTQSADDYRSTLAFDNNGNMKSYSWTVGAQSILNDGYTEAMTTFVNLINGGSINHTEINRLNEYLDPVHPRTAVGRNNSGDIFIFVSDGRRIGERGLTAIELAQVLLSHGMTFAQMLDGGGSSQVTMYHSNINKLSDKKGTRNEGYVIGQHERSRSNFLYVGKDKENDPLTNILAQLGNINKNSDDRLSEYENMKRIGDNWIGMSKYLVNGWTDFGTAGANVCRAWITPDNMLYLVGNIRGRGLGEPFMVLPKELLPIFSLSFVVSGQDLDTLYRVTVSTTGNVTLHALSGGRDGRPVGYCKLDGIFFPILPRFE